MNETLIITHGQKFDQAPGGVAPEEAHLRRQSLAMVYPVRQTFRELFSSGDALCRGTLFRELYKPFLPGGRTL